MNRIRALPAAVLAAGLLAACSSTVTPKHITSPSSAPSTTAATTQPPTLETSSDTAPAYVTPTKGDFEVTLKVLSKECFGDAGCNLTYRAKLSQSLPTGALDPDITYDLTYVVHGDESGPQTETMYITGDQYEQPSEGLAQTPSSGTRLTVTVTKIEAE